MNVQLCLIYIRQKLPLIISPDCFQQISTALCNCCGLVKDLDFTLSDTSTYKVRWISWFRSSSLSSFISNCTSTWIEMLGGATSSKKGRAKTLLLAPTDGWTGVLSSAKNCDKENASSWALCVADRAEWKTLFEKMKSNPYVQNKSSTWLNQAHKIGGQAILSGQSWIDKGIFDLPQLLNSQDVLLSFKELKAKQIA